MDNDRVVFIQIPSALYQETDYAAHGKRRGKRHDEGSPRVKLPGYELQRGFARGTGSRDGPAGDLAVRGAGRDRLGWALAGLRAAGDAEVAVLCADASVPVLVQRP